MKMIIVSLFVLTYCISAYSQTLSHVEFAYDAAGNRTTRQIIYLKSTEADSTQQLKESTFEQVADSVAYKSSIGNREVSIFPNPTKGILTIAMANPEDENPVRLEVFSLAGESILQQAIRQPKTMVDLRSYPAGTYILTISLVGSQRSWKVIKE
jgi:hypothetical protein